MSATMVIMPSARTTNLSFSPQELDSREGADTGSEKGKRSRFRYGNGASKSRTRTGKESKGGQQG